MAVDRIRIEIPLPPAHFQRPRPNKRTGKYYSPHAKQLEDWQGLIRNQMRLRGAHILEGPVGVEHHIGKDKTIIIVTSVVGSDVARPKGVRADQDNIVKFNHDALEGFAYFNDRQVVTQAARFM